MRKKLLYLKKLNRIKFLLLLFISAPSLSFSQDLKWDFLKLKFEAENPFEQPFLLDSEKVLLPQIRLFEERKYPVISSSLRRFLKSDVDSTVIVWIFFTDKGIITTGDSLNKISEIKLMIPPETIKRRAKVSRGVDFLDFPLNHEYVEIIVDRVIKIRNRSRWFNGVSAAAKLSALEGIARLPFVRKIEPIKPWRTSKLPLNRKIPLKKEIQWINLYSIDYGPSLHQLKMLNIPRLHEEGFSGRGVRICIMDTGFMKTHAALRTRDVIAERDFVFGDNETQNEPEDTPGTHKHGTGVFSVIGGYYPGEIVGPAYGASFILAKTEDIRSETPIEEDNWIAGVEWADSLGADIITSSLAYFDFDGETNDYSMEDLNGRTGRVTIAADLAVQRGIVVVNAMGNEGPGPTSLWMPADAFNILSVGAVYPDSTVAPFSSRGPTYDGRIKPEVCAQGVATYWASAGDTAGFGYVSGTSLATPLIAGSAALILEKNPDWTPLQVRAALMQSSSNHERPNNETGWGIPNVFTATYKNAVNIQFRENKITLSQNFPNPVVQGYTNFRYTVPTRNEYKNGIYTKIEIFNIRGQIIKTLVHGIFYPSTYITFWDGRDDEGRPVPSGVYFYRLKIGENVISRKLIYIK